MRELSQGLAELGYGVVAWNETVVGREGVRQLERAQQKRKAGDALWLATQVRLGVDLTQKLTVRLPHTRPCYPTPILHYRAPARPRGSCGG